MENKTFVASKNHFILNIVKTSLSESLLAYTAQLMVPGHANPCRWFNDIQIDLIESNKIYETYYRQTTHLLSFAVENLRTLVGPADPLENSCLA
jgi:hypothetical protein